MKLTIRMKEGETLPERSKDSERWSFGNRIRATGMQLYKNGGREGYQNKEGQCVSWVRPGDAQPRRRFPRWEPICYQKNCKNCGFWECKGCQQNPTNPVCKNCHAPHMEHECPKSEENPVLKKKWEEEIRELRLRDNLQTGQGLAEQL